MPYDEYSLDQAKKKGLFNDKVFDPKVLQLTEEEKTKLKKTVSQYQQEEKEPSSPRDRVSKVSKESEKKEVKIELNFIEKIISFFLSIFGIESVKDYKIHKALKLIEKSINKYKPPVYNFSSQRVTKFFAYKLYDIYMKLLTLKKIFDSTINKPEVWNMSSQQQKTGIELFFEKLMNINSSEVDNKFSYQGISKIVADFESFKMAEDNINRTLQDHLSSITNEKATIATVNSIYTNVLYFKNIIDFDFNQFFKRFDPQYSTGISPSFKDIPGEALIPYLSSLEESFLQIDLNIDNTGVFKILYDVGKYLSSSEEVLVSNEDTLNLGEALTIDNTVENLAVLFDSLRDFVNKNYFTQLLQLIKKDPLYFPTIIHTRHDFYKTYCEIFEQRVQYITRRIIKEKKMKKLEDSARKVFNTIKWSGIYNNEYSKKVEEIFDTGFNYCYHIGIINTYITDYYNEMIKNVINLIVTGGIFVDKFFQKSVSDTFYSMEKYEEKLRDFNFEISEEGLNGKKISSSISKKENIPPDQKRNMERIITGINVKAKDLFDEFYSHFVAIADIISKIYSDITSKPPKYIRNIRTIGGLKNNKFINTTIKCFDSLQPIKELIIILKD